MRTELNNSRCVLEKRKRGGSDKKRGKKEKRKKENVKRCYLN